MTAVTPPAPTNHRETSGCRIQRALHFYVELAVFETLDLAVGVQAGSAGGNGSTWPTLAAVFTRRAGELE